MDSIQFGAFVSQLRKERNMTQKELADQLHVTDKAVSKWETGKGFPDLKLLEPLAQALGVSLVELILGERNESDTLTAAQAESVVSQALDQSQKTTARRYLRLFRYCLTGGGILCALRLLPQFLFWCFLNLPFGSNESASLGVIGGADGPTVILTNSAPTPAWLSIGLPILIMGVCVILAIRVWKLERKLK